VIAADPYSVGTVRPRDANGRKRMLTSGRELNSDAPNALS
jgi:hypothetical protein